MVRPCSQSSVAVTELVSPSAAMLAINAVKSIIVLRLFSNLPGKYIRQRRRTPNDGSYDSVSCPGSVSSIARRFALTHRGLNLSVGLTESSYQQAFDPHFRIILASRYEIVSNMKLA